MAVTSIVAVAVPGVGQSITHHPFVPDAVYQLTDENVFIQIALPVGEKLKYSSKGKQPPRKVESNPPTQDPNLQWWDAQVIPTSRLTDSRPLGYNTFSLENPRIDIHYYLWPARLFDRQQWMAMMADIEREVGVRPWGVGDATQVSVRPSDERGSINVERSLDRLEKELRAAYGILQRPYTEIWAAEGVVRGLPDLPENRLVSRWFLRRQPHVDRLWRYLDRRVAELDGQHEALMGNPKRQEGVTAQRRTHRQLLHRTRRIRNQLARWRHEFGITTDDGGLVIGPAMLRDHRLRRLLSALRPTPDERLHDAIGRRSTLPPMRTPQFFELWGAVWLVDCLRDLGWQGPPPRCWGADRQFSVDGLHGARWTLTRGAVELQIDWECPIEAVTPEPVAERPCSALDSAAQRIAAEGRGGCIYATRPKTPDYVFRLRGPGGRALAIGDASMADPKFQDGKKIDTIGRYSREVAWLPPGETRPVRCAPLGLFLLLPGTLPMWTALDEQSAACDCRIFAASAGPSTNADRQAVESWIDYMVAIVAG